MQARKIDCWLQFVSHFNGRDYKCRTGMEEADSDARCNRMDNPVSICNRDYNTICIWIRCATHLRKFHGSKPDFRRSSTETRKDAISLRAIRNFEEIDNFGELELIDVRYQFIQSSSLGLLGTVSPQDATCRADCCFGVCRYL